MYSTTTYKARCPLILNVPISATGVISRPPTSVQGAQQAPQVVTVQLQKKSGGLGLSIVAARGTNQPAAGIYVKSVVAGGAAHDDGRLAAGDQLLAVDASSLVGVTQERAAELMCRAGPLVSLTVAKEAAYFHDLDALLNKSPLPHHHMLPVQQAPHTMGNLSWSERLI